MSTEGDSEANRQDATQSQKSFHISDVHGAVVGCASSVSTGGRKHSVGRVTTRSKTLVLELRLDWVGPSVSPMRSQATYNQAHISTAMVLSKVLKPAGAEPEVHSMEPCSLICTRTTTR